MTPNPKHPSLPEDFNVTAKGLEAALEAYLETEGFGDKQRIELVINAYLYASAGTGNWISDILAAPRGKTFKRNKIVGKSIHEIEEFIPDYVWVATKCQKVLKSYFIPQAGKTPSRWSGLATGEEPVAWQAFVVPVHPYASKPEGIAA